MKRPIKKKQYTAKHELFLAKEVAKRLLKSFDNDNVPFEDLHFLLEQVELAIRARLCLYQSELDTTKKLLARKVSAVQSAKIPMLNKLPTEPGYYLLSRYGDLTLCEITLYNGKLVYDDGDAIHKVPLEESNALEWTVKIEVAN